MEEEENIAVSSPISGPGEENDGSFMCLFDMILKWADVQPNKALWSFVDHNGVEVESLSYFLAAQNIGILANELLDPARGQPYLKCGDCVLLVYPAGLPFIVAFMACLRAGLIAVPLYPPDIRHGRNDVGTFSRIVASCGAKVVLTCSSYNHARKINSCEKLTGVKFPELQWITTDSILQERLSSHLRIDLEQLSTAGKPVMADDLAFLQYTSGSTSSPKGVIVTHGNLYHNLSMIIHELDAKSDTIVCSWLPQYHDMGLIGSYLGVICCGGKGYYMSSGSFIRCPAVWIWAIDYYRATHLQSPDFGYILCAKTWKSAQKQKSKSFPSRTAKVDLSCVRHMLNGAEPIDYRSIDAFYEAFCPFGLKRGVIFPAYGLAEHTLFACGNGRLRVYLKLKDMIDKRVTVVKEEVEGVSDDGSIAEEVEELDHHDDVDVVANAEDGEMDEAEGNCKVVVRVGCGKPSKLFNVDIKIVDPSSFTALDTDRIGEIWVKSDSKARGYWGSTVSNSLEIFCAQMCNGNNNSVLEMGKCALNAAATSGSGSIICGLNNANDMREGYLRTGDEGFFYGGELFVCGRIKDVIINLGRNFYPQDIERSIEKEGYTSLRPGCSAAFTISSDDDSCEEKLVLVCEARQKIHKNTESQFHALAESISATVKQQYGIPVSVVVLLPDQGNVKTTSGKIARQLSKKAFINGEFNILYQWNATDVLDGLPSQTLSCADFSLANLDVSNTNCDELQASLSQIVTRLLGSSTNVYPTVPLCQMGMDSLSMGQFSGYLSQYGLNLSVEDLYGEDVTIERITNFIKSDDVHLSGDTLELSKQDDFQNVSKFKSRIVNNCPCCICLLKLPCC